MRLLAPKDAIAYLEISDLSETLNSITDNKFFQENSNGKADFSAFKNIQIAVVVRGFEISEKQITDENSVLDFKSKFVTIADTHAWNWQAVSIAENQIGKFASENYGENVRLAKSEKRDAEFFVWTSREGSKLFAAVSGSVIYVGNDDVLLEKCLAVKRGEAESLLNNEGFSKAREKADPENLRAFGYVSHEGIKDLAGIISVFTAVKATENEEARSLISQFLAKIFQNTTREIVWTARKTGGGIEDEFFVYLTDETVSVFSETLAAGNKNRSDSAEFLPSGAFSVTGYNLQNPLVAWRSLLSVAEKNTDSISGKYLVQFSDQLLAPYGISNAELFLSAVDSDIYTILFDAEGENSAVVVTISDAEKIKKSIAEINFKSRPEELGDAQIWKSKDGEFSAAFIGNKLILGNRESLLKCLRSKQTGENFANDQIYQKFSRQTATAVTVGKETGSAKKIVSVLGNPIDENKTISSDFITETRFTNEGIERKTVSTFGFLGTILENLKSEM